MLDRTAGERRYWVATAVRFQRRARACALRGLRPPGRAAYDVAMYRLGLFTTRGENFG